MPGQPRTRQNRALILRTVPKEELLSRIAEGQTYQQILAEVEPRIGKKLSFYYLYRTLLTFGEEYDEARRMKAAYHADRISMTTDLVEAGQMDPGTARIASENHKWLASKSDPAAFGERLTADINVVDMGKLHLAALRERMKSFRASVVPQSTALVALGALPAPKSAPTGDKAPFAAPRKRGRPRKVPFSTPAVTELEYAAPLHGSRHTRA